MRKSIREFKGYIHIYQPNHPNAHRGGYVDRAVLNWEEAHGPPFPQGKEPHHRNLIRDDDRPENILPLTRSEHMRLHHLKFPGKGELLRVALSYSLNQRGIAKYFRVSIQTMSKWLQDSNIVLPTKYLHTSKLREKAKNTDQFPVI